MTPERVEVINHHRIEEFYWAGKNVVYFDNKVFSGSFEEAKLQCTRRR